MRKPLKLSLGLVAAAATMAMMTGCEPDPNQDVRACTDRNNKIVDDSFCQQQPQTAQGNNPNDQFLYNLLIYRWAFGGNYYGGYVRNNSWRAYPSVVYVSPRSTIGGGIVSSGSRSSFVSRGGFGGSFGGGESAGS